MSENNRVVWSEGMFLRPQHFQQHDRFIENWVNGRCRGLRAYDWGFRSLKLDLGQLGIGKLALLECSGVFPDGTPFSLPDDNAVPLSLELPQDVKNSIIYLCLPQCRPDSAEIDSDAYPDSLARYHLCEREARDNNSGSDGRYSLQIGALRTRLMLARQERSGYVCLGIAKVVEVLANKTVVLDEKFIPPALNCIAAEILGRFLRELHGLLHTRGEALAGRVVEAARGGASEMSDFLLLLTINRYEPVLEHLGATAALHPEEFYRLGLELAGELAIWYKSTKRPISFPVYDHDDLQATFDPLMDELRQLLSMVLEQNAIKLLLEGPKFGVYWVRKPDVSLLDNAMFVLAVKASVSPARLQSDFPPLVKIGPVEDIQLLVRSALPGITIELLAGGAPRQIPFRSGFSYFQLVKQSELWKKLSSSGGLAIHIGGSFPDLELELWAIKKG